MMTDKFQKWLQKPLRYTEAINKQDETGEKRQAAERAITVQLSNRWLEHSFVEHARSVYACILEHFPPVPEAALAHPPEEARVVLALLDCIYRWYDGVADYIHPSEAEATEVSQQLILLGLSLLSPYLVEASPQVVEEAGSPVRPDHIPPQLEMQAQTSPKLLVRQEAANELYYLEGDIDRDVHDTFCCCGVRSALPHRAIGASLYKLDIPGLQALYDFLQDRDDDSFADWCNWQESQATYYGLDEEAAIREALRQARKDGWLVINYPASFPWIAPVLGALRGVVGNGEPDDGYPGHEVCACNQAHKHNNTVCSVCYARLICHILCYYAYLSPTTGV